MKELFFILAVVAMLFGLTAIRYRKQIVAAITFYKQIQQARERMASNGAKVMRSDSEQGIQLIKCKQCGKWVPQSNVTDGVNGPVCAGGCDA